MGFDPDTVVHPDPLPVPEFPKETSCDVAIVGAGVNGLLTAAYLARAGLKVVLLERRYEIGGGLATEEVLFPGYYSNTHAVYHMMADYMPAVRDFDLARHGLQFIVPNVQTAMVFRDGTSLSLCRMIEDTKDSLAKVSQRDADKFGRLMRTYRKMVDELIAPATYLPPVAPLDMAEALGKTRLGKELLRISEMSAWEIIDSQFQDPKVKTLLLYAACMWGIRPQETGLGFLVPLYLDRACQRAVCYGGSHKFAGAIVREVLLRGGAVLDCAEVTRVLTDGGRATGVEMFDGRTVRARAVVSSLDPQTTFLRLMGGKVDGEVRRAAEGWQWDPWSFFTLSAVLKEPPKYRCDDPWVNEALMVVAGFDTPEELLKHWEAVEAGRLERIGGHITTETLFDPTLARVPGHHVGFFQLHAPYDLRGGWEKGQQEVAQRAVETWRQYAPNLTPDKVEMVHSETPVDIERRLPNMVRGSIKHGAYTPTQMGTFRPNEMCSGGRTPVPGLYLCGASVYPGGLILGGPGYIASGAIADDLGAKRWWAPPAYIRKYARTYLGGDGAAP